MHILFVTGEYPPMPGGVGAYTAELAQALGHLGITISIITDISAEAGENSSFYPQIYPQVARWRWRTIGHVAQLARRIEAQWIHVQYQTAAFQMHPAINVAPRFWRQWGFYTAWTYHDLLVPYLFPKAGAPLRRWVTELPASAVDLTVATNASDFSRLSGKARRLVKIPIGSNISGQVLDEAARAARRAQRGYSQDDLIIAYFGFLNRSKGGMTLIETLDVLLKDGRNAYLLMVGERVGASDSTNHRYLQEVEAHIAALGLGNRVKWTGYQSDAEVGADLNAADVLVMPYMDGVSLRRGTLMAGLANGAAIVTTAAQEPVPELVDGEDLLLVPPGDPRATAAAIGRLADDRALADRLRRNARRRSRDFTWEAIAAQHREQYSRSMARS